MIIYMATNIINGHKYIGQTVRSLELRIKEHIRHASNNADSMYFHRALRKYHPESFTWSILRECNTIEELNKYETDYIGLYNTYNNGYNCTYGGQKCGMLGLKHTEKSKLKTSKSMLGRTYHGTKKGHEIPVETRLKISTSLKGRFCGKDNSQFGKCGKDNLASKPVIINGKYFETLKEAAEFVGVVRGTISYRIKIKKEGYQYA